MTLLRISCEESVSVHVRKLEALNILSEGEKGSYICGNLSLKTL